MRSTTPHVTDDQSMTPTRVSLEAVTAALSQEGWRGFTLARGFLAENPRQWRSLTRAARSVPWETRADFAARQVRFAVLGSFSTENVTDALTLASLERGIIPNVYHAPFNQLSFVIRDPASRLYETQPELVIVAVDPADRMASPLESAARTVVDRFLDDLMAEMALLHERSGALVLVHNFTAPEFRPYGLHEWRQTSGLSEFYLRLNLDLLERCRSLSWVHVTDAARANALSGARWPTLHQTRFLGSYRLTADAALAVAREYAALGAALRGFAKKCLIVDLDNTLWGGVVAEEGVSGIAIGGNYPGNIYREIQQVIHALRDRGVIVAINSKNNEADAWEPFRQRSEMVLSPAHFSAWRINWQDKATNLRELAQELHLGPDSFVVLDDSPVERAWMEDAIPEVHILHAQDPLEMLRELSSSLLFEGLELSQEDRVRAQSYTAAARRRDALVKTTNLEDFLTQLDLTVEVSRPQESQWGRVAQLTQKTNQFNLTTRRYTQDQLRQCCAEDETQVLCCSVRDRFADEGIVGVVILRRQEQQCRIDSFLLSCRVLGRGVERALLWAACQHADSWGARLMYGEYRPSEKNGQTARFFPEQGFTLLRTEPASSWWTLPLPAPRDMAPHWITLTMG